MVVNLGQGNPRVSLSRAHCHFHFMFRGRLYTPTFLRTYILGLYIHVLPRGTNFQMLEVLLRDT